MSSDNSLKVLHDHLLEHKPDGVEHSPSECVLCAMDALDVDTQGGSMESFTQEQVDAMIADAVTNSTNDLQKRLVDLESQMQDTEIGKAVAAAVAEKEATVTELQIKLDAAEAARVAAEARVTETEQFWADAIAAHTEAQAFAERRDERSAQAKEVGVFSEEYLNENADRFAAMTDDDFAARLVEWQLIAEQGTAGKSGSSSKIPATTALQASRADTSTQSGSALSLISEMRERHIDPRTL